MKRVKWLALLLCAALCLGLTGCFENIYENAGTIDGTALPSGLYLNMQYDAFGEAETKVLEQIEAEEGEDADTEDVNVLSKKVEGESAKKWIAARTEEMARKYVAVQRLAREHEVTLSEDNQGYVEQMAGYWEMIGENYEVNGISQESFMRTMVNEMLADELFIALYAEGGELDPGNDAMKEAYTQQNAHLRSILVPFNKTGEEGEESTDLSDEVMPIAEEMKADLEAGKTAEEAAERMEEVYKLLGREYSDTTASGSVTTSYIAYELDEDEEDETYPAEFRASLKDAKVGDIGITKTSSLIMVYEVIPTFESEEQFEETRDSVVRSLYQEDFDAWLAEIYNAYEVKWETGARWYMRPSKIEE